MKIISHRGNLNGCDPKTENTVDAIVSAIERGFDVEIDVWFLNNSFYLGHDSPCYKIDANFLTNPVLWCHAKNKEALEKMLDLKVHCFWHENDRMTITSRGIVWCYPSNYSRKGVTVVFGDKIIPIPKESIGICTDYPQIWDTYTRLTAIHTSTLKGEE